MIKALAGGLLAIVLLAAPALAAPSFPPLSGRVVDEANILSPRVEAELTDKLKTVEETTQHQFVVATIRDLKGYEIEDYGYQLGRAWKIGNAQRDDGVLLIVAPSARKVRIEVGYGLEPVLTDALSSLIIQRRIIPHFKDGDMEEGVEAGVAAIAEQLALPEDEAQALAAKAAPKAGQARGGGGFPWVVILIVVVVVISMIGGGGGGRGGRRRRSSGLGEALPWIVLGALSKSGSRGGWSGGGGGWSGGGGGFSGGGGSFGGGGASGGW